MMHKIKKILRPILTKNKKIHEISLFIYKKYFTILGPVHPLPNYIIIGFERCGTTSLYEYLIRHPNIKPAVVKEIHFFDKYFQRGVNWYRTCFPLFMPKNSLTGEASPSYGISPYIPKRIKKLVPNAKFIILLRNPIDRAYSHYNREKFLNNEPLSFADAILQEENRTKNEYEKMLQNEFYFSDEYRTYSYLKNGIYVDKLKRWFDIFPREQFLILQTEEFEKNPSKIYNQTLEFLGLSKWELDDYKKFRFNKKLDIDPSLRNKLVDYFKPHNQRLFDLLDRKFNWN